MYRIVVEREFELDGRNVKIKQYFVKGEDGKHQVCMACDHDDNYPECFKTCATPKYYDNLAEFKDSRCKRDRVCEICNLDWPKCSETCRHFAGLCKDSTNK